MSRAEKCFLLIYTLNLPSSFDFEIYIIIYKILTPSLKNDFNVCEQEPC